MADIWAFIAQDNPKAASIFIHEIQERLTPLLENPEIGPARDYLSSGLRVHFHRRYAVYYRFTEREVIIIARGAGIARCICLDRSGRDIAL